MKIVKMQVALVTVTLFGIPALVLVMYEGHQIFLSIGKILVEYQVHLHQAMGL